MGALLFAATPDFEAYLMVIQVSSAWSDTSHHNKHLMIDDLQELLEGLRALANEAEGFAARCGASPHRA
jgi:hypothetical protein